MNAVARDIFRAIHEGKWLSIEYRNKGNEITKYWIGIRSLDVARWTLKVDGLHLGQYKMKTLDYPIKIDSILSSELIEGSYCDVNEALVRDIYLNPHKYNELFDNAANLKILNYLEMCNRMDTTPYKKDFALVRYEGVITEEVAKQALDLLDVDRLGLDHVDRNLLMTMIDKFGGGPVGLDTLAAATGEDAGTIEDVNEPYLIKNGLINRTPRGRVATQNAYLHFGLSFPDNKNI